MKSTQAGSATPIRQPDGFGRRRGTPTITIERNGRRRQFRVSFAATAIVLTVLATFATVYLGATAYLVFRDDLIGFSTSQNGKMMRRYEKQISDLRTNIDRLTSQNLVEQKVLEDKINDLLRRQSVVESRGATIDDLLEQHRKWTATGNGDEAALSDDPPSAITVAFRGGSDSLAAGVAKASEPSDASCEDTDAVLAALRQRIDKSAARQAEVMEMVRDSANRQVETLYSVVRRLDLEGFELDHSVGGPFLPVSEEASFEDRLEALDDAFQHVEEIQGALGRIPLAVPTSSTRVTSSFGNRLDPFLRRMAMHSGIDFGAGAGTPVLATAPGTVIEASWNGGYGKSILIQHDDGFATRYAHLSAIDVEVGMEVDRNMTIGKVGSTGRSTGPHLHYEILRDETPQNPAKYLKAGRELEAVLP